MASRKVVRVNGRVSSSGEAPAGAAGLDALGADALAAASCVIVRVLLMLIEGKKPMRIQNSDQIQTVLPK